MTVTLIKTLILCYFAECMFITETVIKAQNFMHMECSLAAQKDSQRRLLMHGWLAEILNHAIFKWMF